MSSIIKDAIEINPINWGMHTLYSGLEAITINPIKDIINYAVPWTKTMFDRHIKIETENQPLIKVLGGETVVTALKTETAKIASAAGLKGDLSLYTSLNAHFAGYAGISNKLITIPLEHIHQRQFTDIDGEETYLSEEKLQESKWNFSDHEIQFLLASSIGEIVDYPFIKIVARITIVALIIGLYFTPLGTFSTIVAFGIGVVLYQLVDRWIGERADKRGVEILTKRFEEDGFDPETAFIRASTAAINTLRKIHLQHLSLRSRGALCSFLIAADGELRFDLAHPSLKKRITRLQSLQDSHSMKTSSLIKHPSGLLYVPNNYA